MPIMLWAIKYWKPIAISIIAITLVSALIGLGIHYQALKGKQEVYVLDVKRLEQVIEASKNENISLKETIIQLKKTNDNYVLLLSEIQRNRTLIQSHYNLYMEKIKNAEIPLNNKGTLSQPYVVIPSGVPPEARSKDNLH